MAVPDWETMKSFNLDYLEKASVPELLWFIENAMMIAKKKESGPKVISDKMGRWRVTKAADRS